MRAKSIHRGSIHGAAMYTQGGPISRVIDRRGLLPRALQVGVVSPYVGIGPIFEHGSHIAWSGNAFLEIDVTRIPLRWSLFGSVRGLGAACADGCDLSGQGLGVGVTYLRRSFGLGVGMGMLHQSGSWYAQPQARAIGPPPRVGPGRSPTPRGSPFPRGPGAPWRRSASRRPDTAFPNPRPSSRSRRS